jgi:DNA-binding transcriptional MerR regulator
MAEKTEWTIHEVAQATGTTSRTLRHYDGVGLLAPSRVGVNGYRYYDQECLVRLQRILLLRELGLGLGAIGELLAGQSDQISALGTHLELLEQERERLSRQITSVRTTISRLREGETLMAHETFDGFDHTQYREEVIERWGQDAYEASDSWWTALDDTGRQQFRQELDDLVAAFADASAREVDPAGAEGLALGRRQYDWVRTAWGREPTAEAFTGLGQMYVDDPRFGKTYSAEGRSFARFVRDVMAAYAAAEL